MVRRVKAYLNHMRVITDEDRLHQMSLECEPPVGGMATHVQSLAITVSNQSVRCSQLKFYFGYVVGQSPI